MLEKLLEKLKKLSDSQKILDTSDKFNIVFEDKDILVIDKPEGLIVTNFEGFEGETVRKIIFEKYNDLFESVKDKSSEFYKRKGIVHRLDKLTSGLLIIAKTPEAFTELQRQFREREVKKEYIAVVFGRIEDELFEVNAPIGRNPTSTHKMAIVEEGRESLTQFEKLKDITYENTQFTLLIAKPRSGRTHQIRVHMAAFNHPVVGDVLYAGRRQNVSVEKFFNRMMLHAYKIAFIHPISEEEVSFASPIPDIFPD